MSILAVIVHKLYMIFKFKQFDIRQKGSLMKVGTDSILLGAWAKAGQSKHILDIGTGTGVIALMLAQRYPKAHIDAVEIDETSALEAKENARHSPFAERVNVVHTSIQKFAENTVRQYDLVVSNPPFFNTGMARNAARHTMSLSHEELLFFAKKLLAKDGHFCVILPLVEGEQCIETVKHHGLYLNRKTNVKPKSDKPIERLILRFSNTEKTIIEDVLIIEKDSRERAYTDAYKALTSDFYLNM